MTINDVLTEVNELKPNTYEDAVMIRWISVLEGKIIEEIIATHELPELADKIQFNGYDINDINTELIVPDTYADVYKYYIYAMIDANNGEQNRYITSMTLFNNALNDYASYINRNYLPISMQYKVF